MRNGIKKLFRIGLFGIFACLFLTGNVHGASVQTLIPGQELIPTANGYNNTYTQGLNEDGSYYLTDGTDEKELIYGHYYGGGTSKNEFWFFCKYNDTQSLCRLMDNVQGNNLIYQTMRIYPYESWKTTTPSTTNCANEKQSNFTGNVCYYKDLANFGEEYNGKLSGLYFRVDRQMQPCFIYEELNELVCPGSSIGSTTYWSTNTYTFSTFDNNYVENPEFIETQPEEETTTETTTILGQCPTIREILSTYSSNYNTGICYSATRLLTQTGIVNTEAQSIFELYPTFTGWLADYNYYRQYCENVPSSVCREAFSGNEIKWSLLNKTPENNPIGVYQYCHLKLNIQDKNATTCVLSTGSYYATGVDEAIEEEIQGNQSVLDIMLNSFNNLKDELPSFSTGTVFDEFLEEGETWKDGFKLDIFKTFLELWSKITSIFIFRHQYDGIIPTYITSIIMIILLFKILKK